MHDLGLDGAGRESLINPIPLIHPQGDKLGLGLGFLGFFEGFAVGALGAVGVSFDASFVVCGIPDRFQRTKTSITPYLSACQG